MRKILRSRQSGEVSLPAAGVMFIFSLIAVLSAVDAYMGSKKEQRLIRMAEWTAACPEPASDAAVQGATEIIPARDVDQAKSYVEGSGTMPDLPCSKRLQIRAMLASSL
jgi:hypothetical protein